MEDYLALANSTPLFLVVGGVLLFIAVTCVVFIIKSYRAGIKIGMGSALLKRTIFSSALFTLVPSISILLGVIALAGTLGLPAGWLRLSVVGNLQYEALAAGSAAQAMGVNYSSSSLSTQNLCTILLVMTVGISLGSVISIFFVKFYSNKLNRLGTKKSSGGSSFASWAMTAMFIGMSAAFIGSYVAQAVNGPLGRIERTDSYTLSFYIPLMVAAVSFLSMSLCRWISSKYKRFEDFSLSLSMLIGMASASLLALV